LKSDLLRGWIDIAECKLLYGFPEKKTEGEKLKTEAAQTDAGESSQ